MSTIRTEWILQLADRVTAPLDRISARFQGVSEAAMATQRHLDQIEARANVMGSRLQKMAIGAVAFGVMAQGSLHFETAMARANTMMDLSQAEALKMGSTVQKLSNEMGILRDDVAAGLYEVVSADVPKDNWISFLTDSSKAAVGGVADLNTVVGVTSTVLKTYQMAWDQAGVVQDKIQKTAKLGKTTFEEMGNSLPRVGAKAQALNVNLDELMGAFATLTGVSGNTSEVSTQLSAIFQSLIKPSAEATKMANAMGIQFDSMSITRAGGVIQFFKQLAPQIENYSRVSGLTKETIAGTLMGSTEALAAFIPLMGTANEAWLRKTNEIANSTGTIERAFEQMNNTTEARLTRFKNAFGSMIDQIVVGVSVVVMPLIDATQILFEWIDSFGKAYPIFSKFVGGAMAVGFGVLFLVNAIGWLIIRTILLRASFINYVGVIKAAAVATWGFIKSLVASAWQMTLNIARTIWASAVNLVTYVGSLVAATAAQLGLNAAMLANPIGIIIAGIVVLIGLIVAVVKYYDDWGAAATLLLGPLGSIINLVMSFKRHWDSIKTAFSDGGFLSGIARIGFVIFDALIMPIQQLLELIAKIPGMGWVGGGAEWIQKQRDALDKYTTVSPAAKAVENTDLASAPNLATDTGAGVNDVLGNMLNKPKADTGSGNSGSRVLNQNLKVNLNFSVSNDKLNDVRRIAEEAVKIIADNLREGAVQTLAN